MIQVTVKEAQENLERLLARVEQGETILIMRPGHAPIRLSAMEGEGDVTAVLPSLRAWRADLRVGGTALSETVEVQRNEERY